MPGPYYIEKLAPFSERINDCLVTPFVYQPTPDGVAVLCEHYAAKYNINITCIDLRETIEIGDNSRLYFNYLAENKHLMSVEEGQSRGLILTHGQHHAIPVLIFNDDKAHNIIIFDSTSGSRVQGYFSIANLFPEAQVYLNSGTRQSDGASCITDAICTLKEALQIKNLMDIIQPKVTGDHEALRPSRFSIPKPNNFNLFYMPEQLLLAAQISKYLTDAHANLNVRLRGGRTLGEYREQFKLQVSLLKNENSVSASINSYLFVKGQEHKKILDAYALKNNHFASIANSTSENILASRSISPLVSPSRIGFYAENDAELETNNEGARAMNFSR